MTWKFGPDIGFLRYCSTMKHDMMSYKVYEPSVLCLNSDSAALTALKPWDS